MSSIRWFSVTQEVVLPSIYCHAESSPSCQAVESLPAFIKQSQGAEKQELVQLRM